MTPDQLLRELLDARARREPCVLATVAAVKGSVPRLAGAKAVFFPGGRVLGTVGGGKFENLVAEDAMRVLEKREPLLKTYPLHEHSPDSFGAICGGEMTVLLEPQFWPESLVVYGAGHCGQALCSLAKGCGWHVTALDDRSELLTGCDAHIRVETPAPDFFASRPWGKNDAIVLVSRNFHLDRDALAAILANPGAGYIGMIGSRRKVRQVYEELEARGVSAGQLGKVYAPIGLDIGADAPAEIAVSILAQIMGVLRGKTASIALLWALILPL